MPHGICIAQAGRHTVNMHTHPETVWVFNFTFIFIFTMCVVQRVYVRMYICGMQSLHLAYVALALRFTKPHHLLSNSLWRAIFPLALYSCWFHTRRRTYVPKKKKKNICIHTLSNKEYIHWHITPISICKINQTPFEFSSRYIAYYLLPIKMFDSIVGRS